MGRPRKATPKPPCTTPEIPAEDLSDGKNTTPTIPSKTITIDESPAINEKKTLDKSRAYGTICGRNDYGARFEQDGLMFDGEGNLVETD